MSVSYNSLAFRLRCRGSEGWDWVRWLLWWKLAVRSRRPQQRRFLLNGQEYPYFYHAYNHTWDNERAVEVPVVIDEMRRAKAGRILEVGNVMSHYYAIGHDVVDKYEKGAGVINADVMDFTPSAPYDLIVTVSTLEHIGWDEQPRSPGKFVHAYTRLTALLAKNGKLVVSFPAGYNADLDAAVQRGDLPCSSVACLKRTSFFDWVQVDLREMCGCRFGAPFPFANGLVFLTSSRSISML